VRASEAPINLGEPHYSVIPLIYNCDTPEYLSQVIQIALTGHEHDDEVLLKYLTALFQKSFKILSNSAQSPKENAENAQMRFSLILLNK
jgi:hypothetical protein